MPEILNPFFDTVLMVTVVVLMARLVGLRSFSKMSSFDFALTVAVGSAVASIFVNSEHSSLVGMVALAAIFGVQWIIGEVRRHNDWAHKAINHTPLLLMKDGHILQANLAKARVTRADLMGRL